MSFLAVRSALYQLTCLSDFQTEKLGSGFFADVFKVKLGEEPYFVSAFHHLSVPSTGQTQQHGGSNGSETQQEPEKQPTDAGRNTASQPAVSPEHSRVSACL